MESYPNVSEVRFVGSRAVYVGAEGYGRHDPENDTGRNELDDEE